MVTQTRIVTLPSKPAIKTPTTAARDVQLAVNNIRERLHLIEEALNSGVEATRQLGMQVDSSVSAADLAALQQQVNQLQNDVTIIENTMASLQAETPTDVYVDGAFIATRHALNFLSGGGIRVTGADDPLRERVDIFFNALVDLHLILDAERARLVLRGRNVGMFLGVLLPTSRGHITVRGRETQFRVGPYIGVDPVRLLIRGRNLMMRLGIEKITQRGKLIVRGRTLIMGTGPVIERAALRVRGRDVQFGLTHGLFESVQRSQIVVRGRDLTWNLRHNLFEPVERSRILVRGHNNAWQVQEPVQRSRLLVRGRNVTMATTANVALPVTRAGLRVRGRDVTMNVSTNVFNRNWADQSNSGMIFFPGPNTYVPKADGTITGSTAGELWAAQSIGVIHVRGYFTSPALPVGSPSAITGPFDIQDRVHFTGTTTNAAGMVWFQADSPANNVLQNGYVIDMTQQLGVFRFIKTVAGSGTLINSTPLAGGNVTNTVRCTHDGNGNYEVFIDGTPKFTVLGERTFTSGIVGILWFCNPANGQGHVSYQAIYNYTQQTARYWRINISAINGGSNVAVADFEWHLNVGGLRVAPSTVAASNSTVAAASNANDLNFITQWETAWSGSAQWLYADFGSGQAIGIRELKLSCGSASGANAKMPSAFTIEYSNDASSWTVVKTVTGATGWSGSEQRSYTIQ
jgi:tetrahydromethanopterin S-methyltransferase subunit F